MEWRGMVCGVARCGPDGVGPPRFKLPARRRRGGVWSGAECARWCAARGRGTRGEKRRRVERRGVVCGVAGWCGDRSGAVWPGWCGGPGVGRHFVEASFAKRREIKGASFRMRCRCVGARVWCMASRLTSCLCAELQKLRMLFHAHTIMAMCVLRVLIGQRVQDSKRSFVASVGRNGHLPAWRRELRDLRERSNLPVAFASGGGGCFPRSPDRASCRT